MGPMDKLLPGRPYRARIVDLPKPKFPRRIGLMLGDRLHLLEADPELLRGLALGDLVEFTLGAEGAPATLERIGGPAGAPWDERGDGLRWRRGGERRMEALRLRSRVLRKIRAYFDAQGFLEVDTPVLVRAPTPEPQFSPIPAGDGYLITSPEFQLKRLLVGGCEKIYRIGPVFRGGEVGRLHNPEFTMLEWYRAYAELEAVAGDLEALLECLAPLALQTPAAQEPAAPELTGQDGAARKPTGQDKPAPVALVASWRRRPYRRAAVAELFREILHLEINGVTTGEALRRAAVRDGIEGAEHLPGDFEEGFFILWERLEPHLGPEPLLVVDWPAPLASLARLREGDPTLADRMELYAGGLELANGFAELTDPAEQRRRFEVNLAGRAARGLPPLPLDEAFLAALGQGMPPAAGMALGVDRLVMLLAGAREIRQVLAFSAEEV